jgi:hypothetical protein
MTKKISQLFILLLFVFQVSGQQSAFPQNQRKTYNFNSDWKLQVGDIQDAERADFDDSSWKSTTLPHAFNEDEAFRVHISQLTDTVVWYRKHFILPTTDKGKKVFIEFEGVRQAAQVFINGQFVGLHENGVMAFGYDVSPLVRFDTVNVISVRVDNDWRYHEKSTNSVFQWNDRNFNADYGGIPKNVWLHVSGKIYQTLPLYSFLKTTGTYIYASDFNIKGHQAIIHAESEVKNETSFPANVAYDVQINDIDGNNVAHFVGTTATIEPDQTINLSAAATVKNLHFWSWGYGYLYDVYTILKINGEPVDVVKTKTGFRKTEFKNGMIYLNDRVIQVKGYAQRTSNEWPAVGLSVPPWLSDYSNRLMVESNGNLVRWMHITPWKQDVESCDRVGLMEIMPAGDSEGDVSGRRWEQRKEVMRDAIIYNRNNPSIVFYECGNKGINEDHIAQMKSIRDKYDPHGGRAIGAREMLNSKIAEYGGEMLYIDKSADKPLYAMEYCRDEALRKYWDNLTPPYHKDGAGPLYRNADASEYNRNQDSFAKEDVIRWNDYFVCRPGTGKRVSAGGLNIVFSDTNTHCRGEENYRRSGEVDPMRIPKDAFFAHQAMWDGWVEIEKQRTYIIGHWNYAPGTIKDVMVVSPADKVELFLNGKSLGIANAQYSFLHSFKQVKFEPGELKAVSYDTNGKVISSNLKITAGTPTALKLTLIGHSDHFKADGADMALVQVEVVDAKGERCPTVDPMVDFSINGPAEWRGGIGQGKYNYILSKSLPAECGVNRVLIRTTTQAGKITLVAQSNRLKNDTLTFVTFPFETPNGISLIKPSAGLKSNLTRGETPLTPSFKVSRRSIDIISADAGANSEKSGLSYDDNETTEWTNDGRISTGWITYHFAKRTHVSSVSIKFTGWRTRSYPIEILVDHQIVWRGKTDQSLGYVDIPFKPTAGKSLTIRLTGTNSEKDAFQNMVEMNGKKELDGFKEPKNIDTKGQLRIIEADIYDKP